MKQYSSKLKARSLKDSVRRLFSPDWETFANYISDKGLLSRIRKELSKLNDKKTTQF